MECQRCHRDVKTLQGNGTYPNSSYKCSKCYDDDMDKAIGGSIAVILWVVFIAICISQI